MTTANPGESKQRDVAIDAVRGAMLLLIALANAVYWVRPERLEDEAGLWYTLRTAFIDGRAYPLFAVLLGAGAVWSAQSWSRRHGAGASRMLRQRGMFLMLIGGLHALVFPGDVLGAYGVMLVVLAPLLADVQKYKTLLIGLGGVGAAAGAVFVLSAALSDVQGGRMSAYSALESEWLTLGLNVALWAVGSLTAPLLSMMLPSVVIGALIAHRVQSPQGLRGSVPVGLSLLLLSAAAGYATVALEEPQWLWSTLSTVLGVAGGVGWLLLLMGLLRLVHPYALRDLAALGRQSLTGYLGITVLMTALWLIYTLGFDRSWSPVQAALVGAWAWVMMLVATSAHRSQGPMEKLQRKWVNAACAPVARPLALGERTATGPQDDRA